MRRIALPLCLVLCSQSVLAVSTATVPDAPDGPESLLAGGWRFEADGGAPPPCDQPPGEAGEVITFEFAVTGGRVLWTDAYGETLDLGVDAARDGKSLTLTTPDGPSLNFEVNDDGTLSGLEMADFASGLTGEQFRKCYEPADRTRIDGSAAALDFFGGAAETPAVRFVDTRFAKKGKDLCLEPEAQYLQLDMVGPLDFSLGRLNSAAIAEKLAADEVVKLPLDELSNYVLESLSPTGLGWEVTVTELIPPNGSRGDTTTIRLRVSGDLVTIPEWQRSYQRCTTGNETTIVP